MTQETKDEIGFVAVGKQVLIDGNLHYADAVDPQAAETIAEALNERRRRLCAPGVWLRVEDVAPPRGIELLVWGTPAGEISGPASNPGMMLATAPGPHDRTDYPGNAPSREASSALASLRKRFGPGLTSGVHGILAHDSLPEVFDKDEWAEWTFKPAYSAFALAFDMGLIAPWKLSRKWVMTPLGKELAAIVQRDLRDSDTRRMAETGTGSVRSTGSAGPQGIAQPLSPPQPPSSGAHK